VEVVDEKPEVTEEPEVVVEVVAVVVAEVGKMGLSP